MTKWKHKSLEWIHEAREENYHRTKDIPLDQVIKKSVSNAKKKAKKYTAS